MYFYTTVLSQIQNIYKYHTLKYQRPYAKCKHSLIVVVPVRFFESVSYFAIDPISKRKTMFKFSIAEIQTHDLPLPQSKMKTDALDRSATVGRLLGLFLLMGCPATSGLGCTAKLCLTALLEESFCKLALVMKYALPC